MEPGIGAIKCTLGLEHLRGQSPESLHRERWTGALTYNLVRLKMLQSVYAAGREIGSETNDGAPPSLSCGASGYLENPVNARGHRHSW